MKEPRVTAPTKHNELRKVAESATPGPWAHGCLPGINPNDNRVYATSVRDEETDHPWTTVLHGTSQFDDARYVAAADPTTVLALLDHIAEVEGLLARLVGTAALSTVQFYGNGKVQLILTPEGGAAFTEARDLLAQGGA